jgi:hypothetical protein
MKAQTGNPYILYRMASNEGYFIRELLSLHEQSGRLSFTLELKDHHGRLKRAEGTVSESSGHWFFEGRQIGEEALRHYLICPKNIGNVAFPEMTGMMLSLLSDQTVFSSRVYVREEPGATVESSGVFRIPDEIGRPEDLTMIINYCRNELGPSQVMRSYYLSPHPRKQQP